MKFFDKIFRRADSQLAVDYGGGYDSVIDMAAAAVSRGAIAAVEIVAGRIENQFMEARVIGSRYAQSALTPQVLGMIGRNLIERGEVLFYYSTSRAGPSALLPAQQNWTVFGGYDPQSWVIDATLQGADTVQDVVAARSAWLHIVRSATTDWPYRGVSALQRANLTFELAKTAEDALVRESLIPAKAIVPLPTGTPQTWVDDLRKKLQNRMETILFPETTQKRGGVADRPQTDWKVQRVTPAPTEAMVKLSEQAQARVIAALGGHPALGGSSGSADREARRQLMDFLVHPLGVLVSHEASLTFDESIELRWDVLDDVRLMRAKTAQTLMGLEGMTLDQAMAAAGFPGWR